MKEIFSIIGVAFLTAIVGRGVLQIENRVALFLLVAALIHLIIFSIGWLHDKRDKKETTNNVVHSTVSQSAEWKKKIKSFLILEIILWTFLIVARLIPNEFVSKHISDMRTYEFVINYLEATAMIVLLIHWAKFFYSTDKYNDEMNKKEIFLCFYTTPIIYISWFAVWLINSSHIFMFLR